ncbi:hypothetical protein LEP1GSC027_0199 [Leptospira interrogans str. 2002000624]|nr:hypothetical protein LEP1GSC027_0199 [Leptospira interrogans str. 2002000624]
MQKSDWTMSLLVFHSSSHNFQSSTGKSSICESSHIYFFTKKLTSRTCSKTVQCGCGNYYENLTT